MARHFFITGGASGMGRHLTGVFQRRGDCVFAVDLNLEALERAAREDGWAGDRVRTRRLDVTDPAEFAAAFDEAVAAFGHIDVMMNVAGVLLCSWIEETPLKEIHAQIDVNVKGVIYGTQLAARHMLPRKQGHIVNLASVAGLIAAPGLSTYCASKFACRGFSMAVAHELRPKGVYVTAICPGTVQTPMLDNQLHNEAADLYFSGLSILTVEDIERAVLRALRKKPYEIDLPRSKAWLARTIDLWPSLAGIFRPIYAWSGRRRMARRRAEGKP